VIFLIGGIPDIWNMTKDRVTSDVDRHADLWCVASHPISESTENVVTSDE